MYIMPFKFNKELWEFGKNLEDAIKPDLEKSFNCSLSRSDDIFDVMDFRDNENQIAVEIKGRKCPSTQYKDTIITRGKIDTAWKLNDVGWKVYLIFIFTDKTLYHQITGEESWKVKLTGTNNIEHFLLPVSELKEFEEDSEK